MFLAHSGHFGTEFRCLLFSVDKAWNLIGVVFAQQQSFHLPVKVVPDLAKYV
jgi:hypothetical protein